MQYVCKLIEFMQLILVNNFRNLNSSNLTNRIKNGNYNIKVYYSKMQKTKEEKYVP